MAGLGDFGLAARRRLALDRGSGTVVVGSGGVVGKACGGVKWGVGGSSWQEPGRVAMRRTAAARIARRARLVQRMRVRRGGGVLLG